MLKPLEKLVPEMGTLEIDLLRKLLSLEPDDRSEAQNFLNHSYFDTIRNTIEHEISELSKLENEEYYLFIKNKSTGKEEKQIVDKALDFIDQELMNDDFKYEREMKQQQKDESDYESSDQDNREDYQASNQKADPDRDESEIDFDEQSQLIENFFANNPEVVAKEFSSEIKECESEYSGNSKSAKKEHKESKPNNIPLLNTKILSSNNPKDNIGDNEYDCPSSGPKIPRDKNNIKSVISENLMQKHPKIKPTNSGMMSRGGIEGIGIGREHSENPYLDSRVKTGNQWQTDAFGVFKDAQGTYNNDKKSNYFYPHVGLGGGAGGMMKNYKMRDTTPMKFTLTTLSNSTNHSKDSRVGHQVGSSCSRVKAKAKELRLVGDSIGKVDESILPKVK